jgi:hypothetical protein
MCLREHLSLDDFNGTHLSYGRENVIVSGFSPIHSIICFGHRRLRENGSTIERNNFLSVAFVAKQLQLAIPLKRC